MVHFFYWLHRTLSDNNSIGEIRKLQLEVVDYSNRIIHWHGYLCLFAQVNHWFNCLLGRTRWNQVRWQLFDSLTGNFQCDTFGQIPLDVFEQCVGRRSGQVCKFNATKIGSPFVLDTVLLLDEGRSQQSSSVNVTPWLPTIENDKSIEWLLEFLEMTKGRIIWKISYVRETLTPR